jgi:hypothetical protein
MAKTIAGAQGARYPILAPCHAGSASSNLLPRSMRLLEESPP